MELLNNYKQYIVIILITVALGYFLGITVSTVVDYRLKDVIVNLPKPKNNITVQLGDETITSKIIEKSNKNKIENFTSEKKHKSKKNKTKKNKKRDQKPNDPNIEAYAKNYNNSEKNKKTNTPYMAFNEEISNDLYQTLE